MKDVLLRTSQIGQNWPICKLQINKEKIKDQINKGQFK